MKKSVRWLGLVVTSSFLLVPPRELGANPSGALATDPATQRPIHWNWLGATEKAILFKCVPPPPAPGSAKDKADLQAVLKAQASRTTGDIAEAKEDEKFTINLVAGVVGPDFTSKNYPVTFDFLKHVDEDEFLLNSTLKEQYKRNRPYQDHPEVKNLFPVKQYSYPSGHAAGSRILALVLSLLFPDKIGALMTRADAIAQSRVTAGVHYPSDINAGKALAQMLYDAFLDNPAFQGDLTKARAEINAKK